LVSRGDIIEYPRPLLRLLQGIGAALMILLPHLLSDFRFLFHYICGSLFIREPVWLFPLLSYCVSCNGFVVLFFYPELIKSLLPFVMVLVFLLLLVRLVLPFTGLFLSLCGPVLYVGSSCLLSLLPCVGVSLLLCCWFCLLCRVPACLLLAFEVEI